MRYAALNTEYSTGGFKVGIRSNKDRGDSDRSAIG